MIRRCLAGFLFCGALAHAQPAFDVASVRALDTTEMSTRPTRSGGRFQWSTEILFLVSYAWHLPFSRVSGLPSGGPVIRVEATMNPTATEDDIRMMLRSLLKSRFKLVAHMTSKEVDGLALTIGKDGFKIKAAPEDDPVTPPFIAGTKPVSNVVQMEAYRVPIRQLAERLQSESGMVVWDETGLTGIYDFTFRYALGDDPDAAAPTLATALRETLGLDYKKHRGSVESLIVDSIEKTPSEN